MAGTSTTTGDGGMLDVERAESRRMVYEVLPSRYGIDVRHLRQADAIELTIGQGAKPGTGGLLLGSKVSDEIARIRDLPPGVDQRSPCRHPDFLGPDDMVIKIEELREATDWRVPIFVKMGASRVFDDVRLAAKAGADVVVVDGMEGGTGASPELLQEHTGIPTLAAVCEARAALEDIGLYGQVQLVIAGGLRHGSDCAKALALGADACYLGTALLIALNCNKPLYEEDYHAIGAAPYACHHCHTGRCPVGITTQDPELAARLEVESASERVANFFHALTTEVQILARACGKSDVHHLEPEDLRALTLEASMIAGPPPGRHQPRFRRRAGLEMSRPARRSRQRRRNDTFLWNSPHRMEASTRSGRAQRFGYNVFIIIDLMQIRPAPGRAPRVRFPKRSEIVRIRLSQSKLENQTADFADHTIEALAWVSIPVGKPRQPALMSR